MFQSHQIDWGTNDWSELMNEVWKLLFLALPENWFPLASLAVCRNNEASENDESDFHKI